MLDGTYTNAPYITLIEHAQVASFADKDRLMKHR